MPLEKRYVATIDFGTIALAGSSQKQYTNDSDSDFVVEQVELPIWLAAALNTAIVGTEIAHFPSPTAADNTHPSRALFDLTLDDGEERQSNGAVNVAALLNPSGKTYLQTPFVLRAGKRITATLTSRSTTATVSAVLHMFGKRVPKGTA